MAWTHYKDLIVWQKGMDLTDVVYALTKDLPSEERFVLVDQMRRAAVSVPSNIAEGHGRQSEKEFKHFLAIAQGSVFEVETQLHICLRQGYLSEESAAPAFSLCLEIGKMLTKLITASASIAKN